MAKIENFNGKVVSSVINSKKLSFGSKIKAVVIADLHSYTKDKEHTKRLAEEIIKQEPDFIFIAGDIFNGGKPWEQDESLVGLREFIDIISSVAPVFITMGNHDIIGMNEANEEKRLGNFKQLEDVRPGEVYPLYNDCVIVNGMEIMGFVPEFDIIAGLQTQLHGIAHDQFMEAYEEKGAKFKSDSKTLKTYLGHNPHLIAASENGIGLESLKVCDFFITGHLHDGYKPVLEFFNKTKNALSGKEIKSLSLDNGWVEQPTGVVDKDGKLIPKSLWPPVMGKTNLCRGIVYIDNDAQQRFLQLPNGMFYQNAAQEPNKQEWRLTTEKIARKGILDNDLHFMIISEGINPGFLPSEKMATINVVNITPPEEEKVR